MDMNCLVDISGDVTQIKGGGGGGGGGGNKHGGGGGTEREQEDSMDDFSVKMEKFINNVTLKKKKSLM